MNVERGWTYQAADDYLFEIVVHVIDALHDMGMDASPARIIDVLEVRGIPVVIIIDERDRNVYFVNYA